MIGTGVTVAAWPRWKSAIPSPSAQHAPSQLMPVATGIVTSMPRKRTGRRVTRGPGDDPAMTDEQLLERRSAWFEAYTSCLNVYAPPGEVPYTCPCCGHPTLSERGGYEICCECGWEDDGQDDHDSALVRGGPNGRLSLDDARAWYEQHHGERGTHIPPRDPE